MFQCDNLIYIPIFRGNFGLKAIVSEAIVSASSIIDPVPESLGTFRFALLAQDIHRRNKWGKHFAYPISNLQNVCPNFSK